MAGGHFFLVCTNQWGDEGQTEYLLPHYSPPRAPQQYPFDFSTAEKPHESYNGLNVRLRSVEARRCCRPMPRPAK